MTSATLKLTDRNGKLDMHVEYEGGLDVGNPSHEHMLLLIATLDQMAEPEGEPIHILTDADANANKAVRVRPAFLRNEAGELCKFEVDAEDGQKVNVSIVPEPGRSRRILTEGDALADLNGTRRPDNHVD